MRVVAKIKFEDGATGVGRGETHKAAVMNAIRNAGHYIGVTSGVSLITPMYKGEWTSATTWVGHYSQPIKMSLDPFVSAAFCAEFNKPMEPK